MQPSECIVVSHHKEDMKGRDKEWKYKRKKYHTELWKHS